MIGLDEYSKKQLVFVFANDGEKLSFLNDNIIVKDKDGKLKHQSTCYRVCALFIIGSITITSGLIERSHKFCFPIFLMKMSLRTYDVIGFCAEGNVELRKTQYSYLSLDIAKHIIKNKIQNQRRMLMKQRHRSGDANYVISKLKYLGTSIDECASLQEIMGVEGAASKLYFPQHFNNCEWKSRKPRIKLDYINSAMDLGYTLLFNFIESMLRLYGFDLYVGVIHREFYMRKSLVCDLVEPFRPLIDDCIRTAISRGQCKEGDFYVQNGSVKLDWSNNKRYILFLLKPLLEYKKEIYIYIRDYYRAFSRQKQISDYPVFEV